MKTLKSSNGIAIEVAQIVRIVSNQQVIEFPKEIEELQHLLNGWPSSLLVMLTDGSRVEFTAGSERLKFEIS